MLDLALLETAVDSSTATGGAPAGDGPSGTTPEAAEPLEGAQGGEAAAPPAAATESAPAGPPAIDLNDPAVYDALQGLVAQQLGPLQQLVQQQLVGDDGQPQGLPQIELDPYADDFGSQLAQLLTTNQQQLLGQMQEMLGQVAQPLQAQMEAQTVAEGNQRLDDMIADDVARNGDLVPAARAQIRPLAEAIFPEIAQRYGSGPRSAELAISQASQIVRGIVTEAGQAAVEQYKNQLGTLAGAPAAPAAGGAPGAQTLSDAHSPDSGISLARRYGQRADQLRTQGAV